MIALLSTAAPMDGPPVKLAEVFENGLHGTVAANGSQQAPWPATGMESKPQQMMNFDSASWQSLNYSFDKAYTVRRVVMLGNPASDSGRPSVILVSNGVNVPVINVPLTTDTAPREYPWDGSIVSTEIGFVDPSGSRWRLRALEVWVEIPD